MKTTHRLSLLVVLMLGGFLYSGSPASTQKLPDGCREVVKGQVVQCQPEKVAGGCMQATNFNVLYPISPLQIKETTIVKTTAQDPRTTPINSSECKIVSMGLLGRYCSATYIYYTATISDYYTTEMGGTVKATSTVTYREDRDYKNTQVSKGHTLVPGFIHYPNGVSAGPTLIPGNTYPVHKSEFDCIVPTTTQDTAKMANEVGAALSSGLINDFTIQGNLWIRAR